MTVGMLVAFLAYRLQFSTRIVRFVDHAYTLKLASVHVERIEALLEHEQSTAASEGHLFAGNLQGHISFRDVWFSYSEADPPVIEGVSFDVRSAEWVGLAAPSGFGKSTIVKLILGLQQPTKGQINVDYTPLGNWRADEYLAQIGAVLQDDALLSGSIRDNIVMYGQCLNDRELISAAKIACIHKAIMKMPMKYETRINDIGAGLSVGQKQRILIARAVFKRPRLLILDEATSNLDSETERAVLNRLKEIDVTTVLISHRSATLKSCDRIIDLGNNVEAEVA